MVMLEFLRPSMVTSDNLEQFARAYLPIDLTELGIEMLVSPLQP